MIAMGVLAVVLAVTGPGMPSGRWQTEISAALQHLSSVALTSLSWIPGWAVVLVLALGFAMLLRRAVRAKAAPAETGPPGCCQDETGTSSNSQTVEENRRDQDQR